MTRWVLVVSPVVLFSLVGCKERCERLCEIDACSSLVGGVEQCLDNCAYNETQAETCGCSSEFEELADCNTSEECGTGCAAESAAHVDCLAGSDAC